MFAGCLAGSRILRFDNKVCFSEDRSTPAYRYTVAPHAQNLQTAATSAFAKLLALGVRPRSGLKVLWFRSSRLSFSCVSSLLVFFVPLRLFARFGLRSEELRSQPAAAGCPLLVTWCAALVSLPPAGSSVAAV